MNFKTGKIINKNGEIIETVVYNPKNDKIYMYELKENELLIKDEIVDIYKPTWNGEKWIETATKEEIEEITKPREIENINPLEQRLSDLEVALTEMLGGGEL